MKIAKAILFLAAFRIACAAVLAWDAACAFLHVTVGGEDGSSVNG